MAASYEKARPLPILIHRASAAYRGLPLLHRSCCFWRLRGDARGRDDGLRQKLRDDKQNSSLRSGPATYVIMAGSGRRRTATTVSRHIRPRPQHRGTNMMNAIE